MGEENKKEKPTGTETDSSSIWGWMHHNGIAIQAISTVVLVLANISLVIFISIQISNQERQFNIINSPAIVPITLSGNIKGGTVVFLNTGILPAKDFKLIW
jgi:hypothetical protein